MNLALPAGGSLELADAAFGQKFNEALVHQVVNAYLAGGRRGSQAQKSRSERRGGGRKPWRQKGTGRSRAGSIRSPIWRGGGVTFAAKPRNWAQKVNRKMYRGALCCILSELIRQDRLLALESFALETPRTKALLQKLKELQLDDVLIVTEQADQNLALAARNLGRVGVREAAAVDPVSLVRHEKTLMTVGALKQLEGALA